MSKLNPQIKTAEVGINELREIKLYPLSIHSQQKMGEEIQGILKGFFALKEGEENEEEQEKADFSMATMVSDVIKKNLGVLLALAVCDDDEKVCSGEKTNPMLDDLTNLQAINIGKIIYDQNYGDVLGELKSLIPKELLAKILASFKKQ